MSRVPSLEMLDGRRIPQFGLGVFQTPPEQTAQAVLDAFDAGYRHIDTATIYRNETGVGKAIAQSGLAREELFVTTKLWNADQGYDSALAALDGSLEKLGLDYVDLYLIHWPCPAKDLYVDSWKALIRAREQGKARSIGVSNFRIEDLQRLATETPDAVPVVNQIELHPLLQQRALRDYHERHGILTESWSPIAQGDVLDDPVLQRIAARHRKTAAQIVLRWHVQLGLVVFPKSVNPARIRENIDIFDFELDLADMDAIAALDAGGRRGLDPADLD